VVIHPRHEEVVRQAQEELAACLSTDSRLEVLVREEVEPGGCVAHGDHGSVDARLSTQLQALRATVQETITGAEAAA
jgi:flagellar biosynthesis/type III secretory pathway protein FliH